MDITINYLAVIAAAVVSFVLGGIWYSPVLFGPRWMRAIGKSEAEFKQGNVAFAYVGAFVAGLAMAYVLALFLALAQAKTLPQAAWVALWAWIGFMATPTLSNYLFSGWSRDLYLINNGYSLISLLIMGGILATWT
jgi:hypothetical protein